MNDTLPPLHADFVMEAGNAQITLSLAEMPTEYTDIYKETHIAVKSASTPTKPTDYGYLVILQPDKSYVILDSSGATVSSGVAAE